MNSTLNLNRKLGLAEKLSRFVTRENLGPHELAALFLELLAEDQETAFDAAIHVLHEATDQRLYPQIVREKARMFVEEKKPRLDLKVSSASTGRIVAMLACIPEVRLVFKAKMQWNVLQSLTFDHRMGFKPADKATLYSVATCCDWSTLSRDRNAHISIGPNGADNAWLTDALLACIERVQFA